MLNCISIQNKTWIKQAIPAGTWSCHEAENFLPAAQLNENTFFEEP